LGVDSPEKVAQRGSEAFYGGVEQPPRLHKVIFEGVAMKSGTVVFRVIVCIWLFGLTMGMFAILRIQQKIQGWQLISFKMDDAVLSQIELAAARQNIPGPDLELRRNLGKMSSCKTWYDLNQLKWE